MDAIDPKQLRIKGQEFGRLSPRLKKGPPRHKPGEKFLKGPIPWKWLVAASRQPGKALHVGIALWFLAGLTRSRQIKLTSILLNPLGVTRHTKRRSLAVLKEAGLIQVEQQRGKNPVVTLLDPPSDLS